MSGTNIPFWQKKMDQTLCGASIFHRSHREREFHGRLVGVQTGVVAAWGGAGGVDGLFAGAGDEHGSCVAKGGGRQDGV